VANICTKIIPLIVNGITFETNIESNLLFSRCVES